MALLALVDCRQPTVGTGTIQATPRNWPAGVLVVPRPLPLAGWQLVAEAGGKRKKSAYVLKRRCELQHPFANAN